MPDIFDSLTFELEEEAKAPVKDVFESLQYKQPSIAGQTAKQLGKSALAGLVGGQGSLLGGFGLASNARVTPGQEALFHAESQLPESKLPFLQDEDILPNYARLPTTQDVEEFIGETDPQSMPERYAQRVGRSLGSGISFGALGPQSLATLGTAAGIGQSVKEMGAPDWVADTVELLSVFAPAGFANKVVTPEKQRALVDYARSQGLNEREIVSLLQGKGKLNTLSKIAKKSGKTERLLSSLEEKTGGAFDHLKKQASNLPRLPFEQVENLENKFGEILSDLRTTLKPSPDKEGAIKFIEGALENLRNRGATPEELINFYQDINSSINWRAIHGGKKKLAALKEPILETIRETNPTLAKDFELTNELYSKYKQLGKALKPTVVDKFLDKGPAAALALGIATFNPGVIGKYLTASAARSVASSLLTNPRAQNVSRKILTAMNENKPKSIPILLRDLERILQKDHPQEEFNFKNLEGF